MSSISAIQEILQLLEDLENRAIADPRLKQEWEQARNQFPHAQWQAEDHWRFREWFLLERQSEALGSQPILAWSPDALGEKDLWSRLMDSLMGVFVNNGSTRFDDGTMALELSELWTGRVVPLLPGQETDFEKAPEDSIFLGRLVQLDHGFYAPLPGFRMACAPGLLPALERDLAAARATQSRARLSQLELEKLCNWVPASASAEPSAMPDLQGDLVQLLAADPNWDLEKLQQSLAENGLGETLNLLAFETELDLEPLRRILPEYDHALRNQAESDPTPTLQLPRGRSGEEQALPSADAIHDALSQFDLDRSKGQSLEQSFQELEKALGLPEGISAEPELGAETEDDPVGFIPKAGIRTWLDAYAWESLNVQQAPAQLTALADFLEGQKMGSLDAEDLTAAAVLPFLLAAGQPQAIQRRHQEIRGFLDWAEHEQSADLGPLATETAHQYMERICAVLELNAELAQNGTWKHRARVAGINPIQVPTDEANVLADVDGLPSQAAKQLEVGDLLLGNWKSGRFVAMGVIPKEAAPVTEPAGD